MLATGGRVDPKKAHELNADCSEDGSRNTLQLHHSCQGRRGFDVYDEAESNISYKGRLVGRQTNSSGELQYSRERQHLRRL